MEQQLLKFNFLIFRNAALQLYGALIPKLIGQKKASGTEEETIATVGCDELRTHSPKLWNYILCQLKNDNYTDKLLYHSNLVPILNMLANIAKRYNFTYDISEMQSDADFMKSFIFLLDSPIYCVRRLTAKCISNIFNFDMVYDTLKNLDCASENFLHGSLLLVLNYKSQFRFHEDTLCHIKHKFQKVQKSGGHSYLSKSVYENIFDETKELNVQYIQMMLDEVEKNSHAPGIYQWAKLRLDQLIDTSSWEQIPLLLKNIMECNYFEHCCESLLLRMEKEKNIPKDILFQIAEILSTFHKKFNSGITWRILYEISLKTDLSELINVPEIVQFIEGKQVAYKLRYIIPLLARICPSKCNEQELLIVAKTMNTLSDPEFSDVDLRYIAATANNDLGNAFKMLPEVIKVITLETAIVLLQDEDEDVRNLAVNFYNNIINIMPAPHPYICLQKLLDRKFLCTVLSPTGLKLLCSDLEGIILCINSDNTDDYNPFANDSKNIYMEGKVFEQFVEKLRNVVVDFE